MTRNEKPPGITRVVLVNRLDSTMSVRAALLSEALRPAHAGASFLHPIDVFVVGAVFRSVAGEIQVVLF